MSSKKKQDRNFDKMVDKFERKVYDTVKGEWRLKLLKEDLQKIQSSQPLAIWDAGCGLGQIGLWLAQAGHQMTMGDLSHQMLIRSRQSFAQAGLEAEFIEGAAQDVAHTLPQFDAVVFHAVLEWLAEPKQTLQTIASKVKPVGYLSLLFFNRNSVVMQNALKGGWRLPYVLEDAYVGVGRKLTPPNPQIPEEVYQWLHDWGFEIEVKTGIRVFHDYMTPESLAESESEDLFALEYRYCRAPTFCNMGRYIHVLAKRNTA